MTARVICASRCWASHFFKILKRIVLYDFLNESPVPLCVEPKAERTGLMNNQLLKSKFIERVVRARVCVCVCVCVCARARMHACMCLYYVCVYVCVRAQG